MTPETNILPTEWHRKPEGFRIACCPVCAFPGRTGEHRAVTPEENMAARWLTRRKGPAGWKLTPVFESDFKEHVKPKAAKQPTPSLGDLQIKFQSKLSKAECLAKDRGEQLRSVTRERKASQSQESKQRQPRQYTTANAPADDVAEKMGKAAYLFTCGKTTAEVAEEIGITPAAIHYYRTRWKDTWQTLLDKAAANLMRAVRAMADTDKILDDPDQYLRMAHRADRLAAKKGVELFPAADGELTLCKFYTEWYLPNRLGDGREKTKEAYRNALQHWRLLTGDPPVKQITTETIARFRDALLKKRGLSRRRRMSANSARTYMRHIQVLLDKLGQPGPRNRDAVGVLDRVPWAKPPREVEHIPKTVTIERMSACIQATAIMEVPVVPGIKPPAWWRALFIVAWNTGLRAGTLFSMRMDEIEWAKCRMVLPAERLKSRRPMIVHLNAAAMAAMRSIRTDRELVFPWKDPVTRWTFYRHLHRLETVAGIPEADQFGLHAIRRTVATALYEISPGAAQFALGHTTNDVTRKHYVDGGGLVARALDQLPQPDEFAPKPNNRGDAA